MNINQDTSGVKCVFGSVADLQLKWRSDMPAVQVIQHTDSEYLGRIEDHPEGRGISFYSVRPRVALGWLRENTDEISELKLLSGKPCGSEGFKNLPVLSEEI